MTKHFIITIDRVSGKHWLFLAGDGGCDAERSSLNGKELVITPNTQWRAVPEETRIKIQDWVNESAT